LRLHLLDATFELFRAFYGLPFERGPGGGAVHGVRGLIGTTAALLRQADVTHIAAGEGIDPDLWAQFPLAEEALRHLGVVVWPMRDFEADDALATAAGRFAEQVDQVVILSPDKDLAQCVRGERVVTHDRLRRRTYAEADVVEKFGVRPASIPDLLALVGDSADGIPGIPRWGMKSAAAVLAAHGRIEEIPRDPRDWQASVRGAAKLAESLFERYDDALLYKRLATLRTDAPLAESLADLEWRGPGAGFPQFCDALGLRNLREIGMNQA
jgi:5'-3' exonuclease